MSSPFQNRLVGTVILVALAVIFLPDFLDGKKEAREPLFESVPAVPDKKPIVNPEPFPLERVENNAQRPVEIVAAAADDDALKDNESTVDESSQEMPPSSDENTIPSAQDLANQTVIEKPDPSLSGAGWVIQLGSFRHEKNVRLLLDKLEKAGYRAFSRPIQTQSGPLTKVFVGPDVQRSKLEDSLPHLKSLTGLNGKVTRFSVSP
ncbi:SPOR domain-containing protein [Alteromonas sediminis]|uniref:SPOR domain-containing protein n=1 Tax=Alteromonas sediminis TaxID=2259342 RepID=A0A3N5Z4Q8_9ALTE|nr:SPOR domain-containing protein [Alteromonas sediminis]RPJ65114.1 SPOR domain-containing protein [Alteromonas sediminis]